MLQANAILHHASLTAIGVVILGLFAGGWAMAAATAAVAGMVLLNLAAFAWLGKKLTNPEINAAPYAVVLMLKTGLVMGLALYGVKVLPSLALLLGLATFPVGVLFAAARQPSAQPVVRS